MRENDACGDPLVPLVVCEARILEHLVQWAIEIELTAVGQPENQVGEDRFAQRRRLEEGAGVERCLRAVV